MAQKVLGVEMVGQFCSAGLGVRGQQQWSERMYCQYYRWEHGCDEEQVVVGVSTVSPLAWKRFRDVDEQSL